MFRLYILMVVGISFCVAVFGEDGGVTSDPENSPVRIKLELSSQEQEVEIKDVFVGVESKQVIEIENTTKKALAVKEVDVSCGCIVARFNDTPVQPGKYIRIDICVNVTKSVDLLRQKMVLIFDEGEISRKELLIAADVRSELTIEPRTIAFVTPDSTGKLSLSVQSDDLVFKSVESVGGGVLIDDVAPIGKGRYEISVRPSHTFGQATEVLRVRLSRPDRDDSIVRDVVIGLASGRKYKFLPAAISSTMLEEQEEVRILLVFPGAYVPSEGCSFSVDLVDSEGKKSTLPKDSWRVDRENPRVCRFYFQGTSIRASVSHFVVVSCEEVTFQLPIK